MSHHDGSQDHVHEVREVHEVESHADAGHGRRGWYGPNPGAMLLPVVAVILLIVLVAFLLGSV